MSFNTANIEIFQPQPRVVNIEVNTNNRVVSVNGKIGSVVLTKNDIGLGNVENISILGVSGILQSEINVLNLRDSGFYPNSNPSGFITGIDLSSYVEKSETGSFVTADQTGAFYAADNPSGFITGVDLTPYALQSETGSFVTADQTGAFYAADNPSGFITGWSTDRLVNGEYETILSGNGTLVLPGQITVPNFNGGKILSIYPYDSIESFSGVSDIILLQNGLDLGARINIDEFFNISIQNAGSGYIDGVVTMVGGTRFIISTSQNGWKFLSDGTIVFPDLSVQSTAFTGIDFSAIDLTQYVTKTNLESGLSGVAQIAIGYSMLSAQVALSGVTGYFVQKYQTGAFYAADNPSGFITGVDLTPYALQNSLEEVLNDNTYVRTTGIQIITGDKYFDNVHINNLYVDGTQTIVNTDVVNVESNYINLNATGGARDAGLFINLNESGIFTGGAYIGWDIPSNTWRMGTGVSGIDLSTLDYIASQQWANNSFYAANNPSGYITGVNLEPYALKSETGSFITSEQTGAFYGTSNPSGFITGVGLADLTHITQVVKNGHISTINKGQPVYISSADGANVVISLASNTGEATSSKTLGLLADTLTINATGRVITEGIITQINTQSANEGDPVWLGPTGNLIYGLTNKPYAPNHLVYLGVVTRSNQNNGAIYVHVQNGFEFDELHNVNINRSFSLQNNDIIQYDSSSGIWFNRQLQTGSFLTTAGGVISGSLTVNNINVQSQVQYSSDNTVKVYQYYNTGTNSLDTVFV